MDPPIVETGIISSTAMDQSFRISKRKTIRVKACVNCKQSHLACEEARPCKRCSDRGKNCVDAEPRKRGRRKKSEIICGETIKEEEFKQAFQEVVTSDAVFSVSYPKGPNSLVSLDQISRQEMELLQIHSVQDFLFSPLEEGAGNKLIYLGLDMSQTDIHDVRSDFLEKFKQILQERLPGTDFYQKTLVLLKTQLSKYKEIGTSPNTPFNIRKEFENIIAINSNFFDNHGTPTIIWARSMSIQYVNKAFYQLTGFANTLPSPVDQFAMANQLSNEGFKKFYERNLKNFIGPPQSTDTFMFPTGIRVASSNPTATYIQGTMCVTFKRDLLGCPFVYVGNFLPSM